MFSPIFSSLSTYASHHPLTFDNSGDESEVYQVALQTLAAYQVKSADPKDRNPWYELKNISGTITETNEQEEYSEEHTYVAGVLQGPAKKVNTDESIVRFTYVNDVAQGEAERTYKNGEVEKIHYVDGVIQGPAERKSLNGDLTECQYVDGKRQGKAKIVFSNRSEYEEFIYMDDVAQSEAVRTNTLTGAVTKLTNVNGIAQGKATTNFQNGDSEDFSFVNGVKEGTFIYRYINGDKLEGKYVSGVCQGKAWQYDKKIGAIAEFSFINGVRQSETILKDLKSGAVTQMSIVNGFPQGKCIRTDVNNDKLEFNVVDGVAQGPAKEFLANGVITLTYVDGKRQGKAKFISTNKQMDVEFDYVDDKSQNFEITDELDVIKYSIENGTGKAKKCYRSGEIEIYSIKDNVIHGPANLFGQGYTEFFTYDNGLKQGQARIEYADGAVENLNYSNNRRHGYAEKIWPSRIGYVFSYFYGVETIGSREKVMFP